MFFLMYIYRSFLNYLSSKIVFNIEWNVSWTPFIFFVEKLKIVLIFWATEYEFALNKYFLNSHVLCMMNNHFNQTAPANM